MLIEGEESQSADQESISRLSRRFGKNDCPHNARRKENKEITVNTERFSMIKKVLCIVAFAMLLSSPAFAVPLIDGNVQGFAEGYTHCYNVTFDIEKGPNDVPGGSLFMSDDGTKLNVGLILPLSIIDNTYGDNKDPSWGTIPHFLIGEGGGKSLEGSDKWELKTSSVELKLDYIDYDDGKFNTRIERFKINGHDADSSGIEFESSLSYNKDTGLFDSPFGSKADDEDGDPIDSPDPLGSWISEVMYEFSIEKTAFTDKGVDAWTMDDFLDDSFFVSNIIHGSPNKLGGHKISPDVDLNPVPEPLTADAGADVAACDSTVRLDGSRSTYDMVCGIESYDWQLSHRENSGYNRTAVGVSPKVSDLQPGFYDVILTVVDKCGYSDTDQMVLAVPGDCKTKVVVIPLF